MNWTKELPTQSGYYWRRADDAEMTWKGSAREEIVLWDADTSRMMPPGLEYFTEPRGEFYPERLTPPPA